MLQCLNLVTSVARLIRCRRRRKTGTSKMKTWCCWKETLPRRYSIVSTSLEHTPLFMMPMNDLLCTRGWWQGEQRFLSPFSRAMISGKCDHQLLVYSTVSCTYPISSHPSIFSTVDSIFNKAGKYTNYYHATERILQTVLVIRAGLKRRTEVQLSTRKATSDVGTTKRQYSRRGTWPRSFHRQNDDLYKKVGRKS